MTKKTFIVDMQHHYIPSEALKLVKKTEERGMIHVFPYNDKEKLGVKI